MPHNPPSRTAQARAFLGAPDDRVTRYAVALGYPAEGAEPRQYGGRKPTDAVVDLERY